MAAKRVAIIGAGGFGREVLDVIEAINVASPGALEPIGFVVETGFGIVGSRVNDLPILGDLDWLRENDPGAFVVCGIGPCHVRKRLVTSALETGHSFISLIHPHAVVTKRVDLDVGSIITAACVLTTQIWIGSHVHLNLASTVGHDSRIEPFVTVSPGVHISGNVLIGEGAFIGTGANILERVRIGGWSMVGAGAAVVNDVPDNSTVVGVPAKVVKMRAPGWHLA